MSCEPKLLYYLYANWAITSSYYAGVLKINNLFKWHKNVFFYLFELLYEQWHKVMITSIRNNLMIIRLDYKQCRRGKRN